MVVNLDWKLLEAQPKIKIGEGKFREVYALDNNIALKLLKGTFLKKYSFFSISLPTAEYTKYKFGIDDFNVHEYETFQKFIDFIPQNYQTSFAKPLMVGEFLGRSAIITQLVKNIDGSISKSLKNHGTINDPNFWRKFDELEQILSDNKIYMLDIHDINILVQYSDSGTVPVFFDYKRLGNQTYPFQFLITNGQLMDKMDRRFKRLKMEYKK